jgi:hypothetical protein
MLMDFTASAAATSTRRPAWPPASPPRCRRPGWYLNVHQGNSSNILSNGQPAIFFRPLLCANL